MSLARKEVPYTLPEGYEKYLHRVVTRIQKRFKLPQELIEDCRSAAAVGLLEAAERFDPDDGTPFFQFAFLRVRGAILDHLRKSSGVPSRIYRALRVIEDLESLKLAARETVERGEGHELTELLEFAAGGGLLYRLSYFDAELEIAERERHRTSPEAHYERGERKLLLKRAIRQLPLRERVVIEERYYKGKTFQEIAEQKLHLSRSWVSRLHAQALKRIRRILTEGGVRAL